MRANGRAFVRVSVRASMRACGVRACERAGVRASVRACERAGVRACGRASVRAGVRPCGRQKAWWVATSLFFLVGLDPIEFGKR